MKIRWALPVASSLCILALGSAAVGQQTINITGASGAVADAVWGLARCTYITGNQFVTCPFPQIGSLGSPGTYPLAVKGQTLIIDQLGGGNTGTSPLSPLVDIAGSVSFNPNAGTQNISFSKTTSAAGMYNYVTQLSVGSSGGSGYSFNTQQKLTCTGCGSLEGVPSVMTVVSASTGAGGSGGINGSCLVTISGQTAFAGAPTQVSVTIVDSAIASINTGVPIPRHGLVTSDGGYYAGGQYLDAVSGCGLANATLHVSYAVVAEAVVPGTNAFITSMNVPPCGSRAGSATIAVTGGGSGLSLQCFISYATVSYGTDNTGALVKALSAMNASPGITNPVCVYIPAGNYLTYPIHQAPGLTNAASGYGCWLGDEHYNSNIFVIPNEGGDVFAWFDSGENNSFQPFGGTTSFNDQTSNNLAGASFRNISVFGNRTSTETQNALAFYGPTQGAYINNIVIDYMNGSAIAAGLPDSNNVGTFTKSHINYGRFEFDGDSLAGNPGVPAVLITSSGSSEEAPNHVDLTNLRFFDESGPSLVVEADPSSSALPQHVQILNTKFEQSGMSQQYEYSNASVITDTLPVIGDEFRLGNYNLAAGPMGTGAANVICEGIQFANPVVGYAALHIGLGSYNIECSGQISGGGADGGHGIQVDNCGGTAPTVGPCEFKLAGNTAADYGLIVGNYTAPTALANSFCSGPSLAKAVVYNGEGYDPLLSVCLDPATAGALQFPANQLTTSQNLLNAPNVPLGSLTSTFASTSGCTAASPCTLIASLVAMRPQFPLWVVNRSYSAATLPIVDQWDTALNIVAALNTGLAPSPIKNGSIYYARVCNQSPVNEVVEPNTSGETGSPLSIAAGACGKFMFTITSVTTPSILISGS